MEEVHGEQTLLHAAFYGNLGLLKKMARELASGAQGEAAVLEALRAEFGNSALHLAAREGRLEVCRYLVEDLRLDINQRNFKGYTPLLLAAFSGRAAATTYLLDQGADPTLGGKIGSPLHAAAGQGHCEIVELLLARGLDVDLDSVYGSPLHAAATCGEIATIKILLEHHADPNKVFNLFYTPLGMAIRYITTASLECIKLLIEAGADVNFMGDDGITYVMLAAEGSLSGIMKCLLDAGANPNISDEYGRTPIEVAALHGSREIVEMLFPLTPPLLTVPEWSIDGIFSHVNSGGFKPMAMNLAPSPVDRAILLANRSLCSLRWKNERRALSDATECRMLRPDWPKACYRQGAAFMALKDYEKACEAFADGLKLDPTSVYIKTALREAREAVKNARCAEK